MEPAHLCFVWLFSTEQDTGGGYRGHEGRLMVEGALTKVQPVGGSKVGHVLVHLGFGFFLLRSIRLTSCRVATDAVVCLHRPAFFVLQGGGG